MLSRDVRRGLVRRARPRPRPAVDGAATAVPAAAFPVASPPMAAPKANALCVLAMTVGAAAGVAGTIWSAWGERPLNRVPSVCRLRFLRCRFPPRLSAQRLSTPIGAQLRRCAPSRRVLRFIWSFSWDRHVPRDIVTSASASFAVAVVTSIVSTRANCFCAARPVAVRRPSRRARHGTTARSAPRPRTDAAPPPGQEENGLDQLVREQAVARAGRRRGRRHGAHPPHGARGGRRSPGGRPRRRPRNRARAGGRRRRRAGAGAGPPARPGRGGRAGWDRGRRTGWSPRGPAQPRGGAGRTGSGALPRGDRRGHEPQHPDPAAGDGGGAAEHPRLRPPADPLPPVRTTTRP